MDANADLYFHGAGNDALKRCPPDGKVTRLPAGRRRSPPSGLVTQARPELSDWLS